jgi:uncharacterized membrane protein YkoI
MKKNLTVVCAAVLTVSAGLAIAQPFEGSVEMPQIERDWFTNASVTMQEALAAAGAKFDGAFTAAKLEVKHGFLVYSLSGKDSTGASHEFVVDAGDGEILVGLPGETEEEAPPEEAVEEEEAAAGQEEEEDVGAWAEIKPEELELETSMADAVDAALDEFSGYPISCQLTKQGEDWVYKTLILDKDFESSTVVIDAGTGDVYEPEEE